MYPVVERQDVLNGEKGNREKKTTTRHNIGTGMATEKREWDGVNISRDSNVVYDRLNGSCGPPTSLGKKEKIRGGQTCMLYNTQALILRSIESHFRKYILPSILLVNPILF